MINWFAYKAAMRAIDAGPKPDCEDCHGSGYIETSAGPIECDCTHD